MIEQGTNRAWIRRHHQADSSAAGTPPHPQHAGLSAVGSQQHHRQITLPIRIESACLLSLQFGGFRSDDLWLDGQPQCAIPSFTRAICRVQVKFEPATLGQQALDRVHFDNSSVAPIEISADGHHVAVDPHGQTLGFALRDPIVRQLEACLLQGLEQSDSSNRRFLDHVIQALYAHCIKVYGGAGGAVLRPHGRLAPWQERRAKEFMHEHMHEDICLIQVARECKLSPSHFARAFRHSTGLPPHRWLLGQRVEKAKDLMVTSMRSLAEIALACGFADQSHLSRVFTQKIGATPHAWRRAQTL